MHLIYLPGSVEVGSLFKDTQMTYVFLWWENSQTRYQDSCSGPFQLYRHGATRSDHQSILIRLDSLHLPEKRKLMGFSEPQFPQFFGVKLSLSGSVKCLGVILSTRLTCREHVDVKMRKTYNLLWACRKACGVRWA